MQLDLSTAVQVILIPIGIYVGKIIKSYADSLLTMNQTMTDHTQKMADLGINLKSNEASNKIETESLKSEIKILKEDLRTVQRTIESRTENLEQGLKFVVSLRGNVEDLNGSVTRIDKEVKGLTIRADTQTAQMEKVALILSRKETK